jgi:hypothetical protein
LEVPLLPQYMGAAGAGEPSGSCPLLAVTLQQLQLVTCAMYQGSDTGTSSAALLLTLLLQRADPGLRAQFLGGPWGSLMMHTMGEASQQERLSGAPNGWMQSVTAISAEHASEDLIVIAQGAWQNKQDFGGLPAATSSLLALAWAHLQVQQQQQGAGAHVKPLPSVNWSVLATTHGNSAWAAYQFGESGWWEGAGRILAAVSHTGVV